MDHRTVALLNSSKSANIFEYEGQGISDLINDYKYFATRDSNEEESLDFDSNEETDSEDDEGISSSTSTGERHVGLESEDEKENELVVEESGDLSGMNCSGQPLRDLQMAEQFSCNCKEIKCTPAADDQRRGCVVQFTPAEILAYNVKLIDMDRGEKNMFILGIMSSCVRKEPTTEASKLKEQTEWQKSRSRSDYKFNGRSVCTKTFLKLLAISPNELKVLSDNFKSHGLEAHKLLSGGRKNNTKSLPIAGAQVVVNFIQEYAEDHAVHLPGWVPGFRRDGFQLLPSSAPRNKVYRLYAESAARAGHPRIISGAAFEKVWLQLCPYIDVALPKTDLCRKCQYNVTKMFRSADLLDEEQVELLLHQQNHLNRVVAEMKLYKDLVSKSKETLGQLGVTHLQPTPPNSKDYELHYSFDLAQQVHYPSNAAQPGPMYFLRPRKCAIFGVCCEGIPKQVNFLVDEAMNVSNGSIGVISYLHFFFERYGLGEKRLHIHCNNCSANSKNNYLLWYFAWRVMKGLHTEVTLHFMPAGHTRLAPDWCFGLLKRSFRRSEVSCLDDLCQVVRDSTANSKINLPQLVGEEDGTVLVNTYDWQAFLSPVFRRLPGMLRYAHFRFSAEHPGKVFYRLSLDEEEESMDLLTSAQAFQQLPEMPPVLPAPGLSQERKAYLYNSIREFVRDDKRDLVCPGN